MASSKCLGCGSSRFEVKQAEPAQSAYKLMFVQCSSCGGVVSSVPYYDAGVLAKDNQKALKEIKNQVGSLEYSLAQIKRALGR